MKPQPPTHILGPGQQWTVVQAQGWVEAGDENRCTMRWWDGPNLMGCLDVAVILYIDAAKNKQLEALCTEHMGYHRWVDNGTVMQWRAEPAWVSRPRRPRMPPRQR